MGCQPCLHNGAPIKSLDTKSQKSLSGWPYSMHIVIHFSQESSALHDSPGRGLLQALLLEPPWTLPYASLLLADFNLCAFSVIKHNCEYSSFQWILQVFWVNYQTRGWTWEPPELSIAVKSEGDLTGGLSNIASALHKQMFSVHWMKERMKAFLHTNWGSHASYLKIVSSQI